MKFAYKCKCLDDSANHAMRNNGILLSYYSVLVNWSPIPIFKLSCGLRQGGSVISIFVYPLYGGSFKEFG